jgi:hypothetical protein
MANTPLLTLDTLTEYPTIVIDGTAYALLPPDALPITTYQTFSELAGRFDALWKQKTRAADEEQQLADVLDQICRLTLQAPPDVHGRLTDLQRLQITQAFLELPRQGLQGVTQQLPVRPKTGASTPRGFNGSTAARIPKPGSRATRAGSSMRAS